MSIARRHRIAARDRIGKVSTNSGPISTAVRRFFGYETGEQSRGRPINVHGATLQLKPTPCLASGAHIYVSNTHPSACAGDRQRQSAHMPTAPKELTLTRK